MSLFDRATNLEWYEEFVDATRPEITSYVRRVNMRSDIDPEDVVSQAYLVVWQRLPEVRALDEPRIWLFKVAQGTLQNMRRSGQRRDNLIERLNVLRLEEAPPDPADVFEVLEQLDRATDALSQLPPRHREVLVLYAEHQLSQEEIAEVLGITPGNVRTRLYRARQQLKKLVDHPGQTRRPHRSMGVAAALAVVVVAGGLVWTRSIEQPNEIVCVSEVSLSAPMRSTAGEGGPATADACAIRWEDGSLLNPALVVDGEVPPLTGCVGDAGFLIVFPTADAEICGKLGLASPDPRGQEQADFIRSVHDDLVEYFIASGCLTMADAGDGVRQILDGHGLTDWSVDSQPPTPERPCASLAFRPDIETVRLVPIPDDS